MVDVRPMVPLLALLSVLALAVPSASAGVVDRVRDRADDVAKVGGLPSSPLLDQLPDPDDDVKWTLNDGGAEAEGGGMRMGASCTPGDNVAESSCGGYACFMDPGSGPLPVSYGSLGRGMVGVGVDMAAVDKMIPVVVHDGAEGSQQDDGQAPPADGGSYGPYDGVFVDPTGHCGP